MYYTLNLRHIQDRSCASYLAHDFGEGKCRAEYSSARLRLYRGSFRRQTLNEWTRVNSCWLAIDELLITTRVSRATQCWVRRAEFEVGRIRWGREQRALDWDVAAAEALRILSKLPGSLYEPINCSECTCNPAERTNHQSTISQLKMNERITWKKMPFKSFLQISQLMGLENEFIT